MKYDVQIVLRWFAQHGLYPTAEFRFAPPRKWRFDFCWEQEKLVLEVEGGAWTGGRHTRGSGFMKDMEKYNKATLMGYRILRTTPSELCMQETLEMVKEALNV